MLPKIVYLLTCRVPGVAVLVFRGDRAKAAELLVLRHENAVLRRNTGRVGYEPAGRAWFAALARLLPRRRRTQIFPVTPATPLARHHKLAAKKYGTSKRRKPGRPPTAASIALCVPRRSSTADQQGRSLGRRAEMITDHVPAVRVQHRDEHPRPADPGRRRGPDDRDHT